MVEGLEFCRRLEELTLSNQKIAHELIFDPESMASIANSLRVLVCENDKIESIDALSLLSGLEVLKLARNKIIKLEELEKPLATLTCLKELDLLNNPIIYIPKFRDHVVLMSGPALGSLNNKNILKNEREFLVNLTRRKYSG